MFVYRSELVRKLDEKVGGNERKSGEGRLERRWGDRRWGMDFTDKFKEEVHARESVRRGCVLRRVSGRVGGREVDEASRKERGETKIERWWKSIEYEFTADVFLEEDCFFSGRRATRTIFADGDTCSCGDYAGEMFEELEGRFPSEREIEKGEGSSRGSGSRSIANIRQRRNESSAEMVPENGYDFMHIVGRRVTKEAIISVTICVSFTRQRLRIERLNLEE